MVTTEELTELINTILSFRWTNKQYRHFRIAETTCNQSVSFLKKVFKDIPDMGIPMLSPSATGSIYLTWEFPPKEITNNLFGCKFFTVCIDGTLGFTTYTEEGPGFQGYIAMGSWDDIIGSMKRVKE